MVYVKKIVWAGLLLVGVNANALLISDLAGATTSAGSCYGGCNHPGYDASNINDHDLGATGNTGLNSWNSGGYSGWVQIDFQIAYVLDRIELYGANGYFNPYSLTGSIDGTTWFNIASGGYHVEAGLSQTNTYNGVKYGAVHDATLNSLNDDISTRYLRYNVTGGSPHWAYLFELRVDGHEAIIPVTPPAPAVPEPVSTGLFAIGLVLLGLKMKTGLNRRKV